jgi:uncharacterized protein
MNFDIIIIILFTSVIQSIFGTGVLLFGTPLLLLNDYSFTSSLTILLPVSILINILQLINKAKNIDIKFYKKICLFSIPAIILSLYFVSINAAFNTNSLIGAILIVIGLKEVIPAIDKSIDFTIKFEKIYLLIMGMIHGISNLGGALLSAIVFSKNLTKEQTRATIAISYLTFAIFQIITLTFSLNSNFLNTNNIMYWLIGVFIFLVVEKFIYININETIYNKIFTTFLFFTGIFLMFKD